MTSITDEKILEFCRAGKGWFWDDDPSKAVNKYTGKFHPRANDVRDRYFETACEQVFKHFSITKPQVYEDGKWYAAEIDVDNFSHFRKGSEILCLYKHDLFITVNNINDTSSFHEKCLTNIRPIPPELWSD